MSSGSLSDAEDELWGKTRSQEKTDKKGKRPKGGADTPEVEGPPNGENQQQHEEKKQRELREDEVSDEEDDPKERVKASKDAQKEDVLDNEGPVLRGRTVGGAKKKTADARQSTELAVSQSCSTQVTKVKSTDPEKKLKGPDSVKPNQPKELAVSQKDRDDPKVIKTETTDPEEKQTGFESVKSTQAQACAAPPNRPTTVEQPKKTPYMWYLAAGVVFLALALPFAHFLHVFSKPTEDYSGIADDESYSGNATTIELLSDPHANFQERMNALKKIFPSQDESLWSTLSDVLAPNATTNPCSMLSLTSSEPFASSPTARSTLTELASALPWMMARQHFVLHHRQFSAMKEEHAREALDDIMRAWSTDVIVIPDVVSMPTYVLDVVQTTCQSNGAGQVVVTTSEEKPEIADTFSIAVRPERTESPLEHITLENPKEGLSATKGRFPSQTDRVWQVVRAAILSHIAETDPVKPAVVIIGAPPGAHRTADQLAQALARVRYNTSFTFTCL
ncbi:TOR1AIP1 [Branchiostoma lanceolatum]|uniref:TOR1AIP1 protein n=1 Tax=Branchiostoma lanceolatum TaxID=7740 RepID=A0A8K0AC97_BRALA|nr:TOR1AIP1 [Branchiostoma lanceolatum]